MRNRIFVLLLFHCSLCCFSQSIFNNSVEYRLDWLGQQFKTYVFSSSGYNLSLLTDYKEFGDNAIKAITKENHSKFLVVFNKDTDSFYQENVYFDSKNENLDELIALDKLDLVKWKLSGESKNILGFKCSYATAEIRGRKWEVWFTLDIIDSIFPWKLKDLPGTVLEASDSKKEFVFTALKVSLNGKNVLPKSLEHFFLNENSMKTVPYKFIFLEETKQLTQWQSQQIANMGQSVPPDKIPSPRDASFELSME